MSDLKVCLISREYPPETAAGGIGTYTYHLAHGLAKTGHRATVISYEAADHICYDDDGVTVWRIPDPQSRWWLRKSAGSCWAAATAACGCAVVRPSASSIDAETTDGETTLA